MTENSAPDVYSTITVQTRSELKVKGSRFVATAIPVPSKEAANVALHNIRTEFYDATHNCYAYRLGIDGFDFRIYFRSRLQDAVCDPSVWLADDDVDLVGRDPDRPLGLVLGA